MYHSNDVYTVSIAETVERYSEVYDASSGDLAIFKVDKASLVDPATRQMYS